MNTQESVNIIGCMEDTVEIHGDIIVPIDIQWEVEQGDFEGTEGAP